MSTKSIIVLLLIVGVILILCGALGAAKQRISAGWLLLRGMKLSSVAWRIGALVAVAGAIAAYPLILRGETKRADRAEAAANAQAAIVQKVEAELGQARDQMVRADAIVADRSERAAAVARVRVELERSLDAQGSVADLGRDRIASVRERAAAEHAAAVLDYRERNPH